jgi:hypothetical protein
MPQNRERKAQYAKERLLRDGPRIRAKSAEWREKNRDHLKSKNAHRRLTKRAMCLVAAARIRARRKCVPFKLDADDIAVIQDIINAGKCQISGVTLTLSGPRAATSPSLDRIDPTKGYVPGNVRVVCHALNAGMGDWGELELRRIVATWLAA